MTDAANIIRTAIITSPSDFRARLISQAEMHDDYANDAKGSIAGRRGAIASKNACLRAYDWIGRDDLSAAERVACIIAETGPAVVALNVACKMLDIPAHVRTSAAIGLDQTPLRSVFADPAF